MGSSYDHDRVCGHGSRYTFNVIWFFYTHCMIVLNQFKHKLFFIDLFSNNFQNFMSNAIDIFFMKNKSRIIRYVIIILRDYDY